MILRQKLSRWMSPVTFAAMLLVGTLQTGHAETVHLGNPPPGILFVDVKTAGSITPILLAGTLSPMTLMYNGQPLKVRKDQSGSRGRSGLWVNGKEFPSADSMGRFFVQLEGNDAAVSLISIDLENTNFEHYSARIPLNRVFLEAALSQRLVVADTGSPPSSFEFQFSGSWPAEDRLLVAGQEVSSAKPVTFRLPPGKTVVVAEYITPSAKRFINIEFEVTVKGFQASEPVLSVESIEPSRGGVYFAGVSNPQAVVKINEQPIALDRDGHFDGFYSTQETAGLLKFKVTLPNGKSGEFQQSYECKVCNQVNYGATRSFGIGLGAGYLVGMSSGEIPGQVVTFFNRPLDFEAHSLQLAQRFSERWLWLISYRYLGHLNSDESDTIAVASSNWKSYGLGLAYAVSPSMKVGAVLESNHAQLQTRGFTLSNTGIEQMSTQLFCEGQLRMGRSWTWSPRLAVHWNPHWAIFSLDAFSFQYGF